MKTVIALLIASTLTGCASFLKPVERYIEGGNTLYSADEPSIRVNVDSSIPFLGTQTFSDYEQYENDAGGSSAKHLIFLFATRGNNKLIDKSVDVMFSTLPRKSFWIGGFDGEGILRANVSKQETGTYYTGIYRYHPDDDVFIEDILDRADIYSPPCRIAKSYQNILKGMNTKKVTITYIEKIECEKLRSLEGAWGVTGAGQAFLDKFSKRSDEAFKIESNE